MQHPQEIVLEAIVAEHRGAPAPATSAENIVEAENIVVAVVDDDACGRRSFPVV